MGFSSSTLISGVGIDVVGVPGVVLPLALPLGGGVRGFGLLKQMKNFVTKISTSLMVYKSVSYSVRG